MVLMSFNKKDQGLYWLCEHFTGEMLAYAKKTETQIFGSIDRWVRNCQDGPKTGIPIRDYDSFWEPALQRPYLPSNSYSEKSWSILEKLSNAIKSGNLQDIEKNFDIDKYILFSLIISLSGNLHGELGEHNSKLYFNSLAGKLEPIPWDLDLKKYPNWGRSLDVYPHIPKLKLLLEENFNLREQRSTSLYKYLKDHDVISSLRNRFLKDHALSEKDLENVPYGSFLRDTLSGAIETLMHNRKKILSLISHSTVDVNINYLQSKIELEITPRMHSSVSLNNLSINNIDIDAIHVNGEIKKLPHTFHSNRKLVSNLSHPDGLNHKYILFANQPLSSTTKTTINTSNLKLKNSSSNNILINFSNTTTQIPLKDNDIKTYSKKDLVLINSSSGFEELQKNHPEDIITEKNEILFKSKKYTLTQTVITPPAKKITIQEGTEFILSNKSSFILNGSVLMLGKPNNRIRFRPSEDQSWYGTVAITHEDKQHSDINWAVFHSGFESWIDHQFFSGTLSIYGGSSNISNSIIANAKGDDGLNIKYCNLNLRNSIFINNSSDAIDADFSYGSIKKSVFKNNLGDAIDFSGGNFLLTDNRVLNSGDKGISVGEQTLVILQNNLIEKNVIGCASKDGSKVYINGGAFYNNNKNIDIYCKKDYFGGSEVILPKNLYQKYKDSIFIDKFSNISLTSVPPIIFKEGSLMSQSLYKKMINAE
jgi:hypothetical protein